MATSDFTAPDSPPTDRLVIDCEVTDNDVITNADSERLVPDRAIDEPVPERHEPNDEIHPTGQSIAPTCSIPGEVPGSAGAADQMIGEQTDQIASHVPPHLAFRVTHEYSAAADNVSETPAGRWYRLPHTEDFPSTPSKDGPSSHKHIIACSEDDPIPRPLAESSERTQTSGLPTRAVDTKPAHTEPRKPPYTYTAMVIMAIHQSPGKALSMPDIRHSLEEMFPDFFKGPHTSWKKTIKNLMSGRYFLSDFNPVGVKLWRLHYKQIHYAMFAVKVSDANASKYRQYLHEELGVDPVVPKCEPQPALQLPPRSCTYVVPALTTDDDFLGGRKEDTSRAPSVCSTVSESPNWPVAPKRSGKRARSGDSYVDAPAAKKTTTLPPASTLLPEQHTYPSVCNPLPYNPDTMWAYNNYYNGVYDQSTYSGACTQYGYWPNSGHSDPAYRQTGYQQWYEQRAQQSQWYDSSWSQAAPQWYDSTWQQWWPTQQTAPNSRHHHHAAYPAAYQYNGPNPYATPSVLSSATSAFNYVLSGSEQNSPTSPLNLCTNESEVRL